MNQDIYNPTEYWTVNNLPHGTFLYCYPDGNVDWAEVSATDVWNRLNRMDWQNATENFHRIVHWGIAFGKEANYHGEYFKFSLD